jgi:hypothetical protein
MKPIIKRAAKSQAWLRIALEGVAGSGKTWSGLELACALAKKDGGRVLCIDSERGSSKLYADDFDFDVLELDTYAPADYIDAIQLAAREGYRVILLDSISHEWEAVLKIADRQGRDGGWRVATPLHDAFVNAMLRADAHVICTMRQVARYAEGSWGGKGTAPKKVGEKPKQREGIEYEFSVVMDLNHEDHSLMASKTRCPALDGRAFSRGAEVATVLLDWLAEGEPTRKPEPARQAMVEAVVRTGDGGEVLPREEDPTAAKIREYRQRIATMGAEGDGPSLALELSREPEAIKQAVRGDYSARIAALKAEKRAAEVGQ